MVGVAGAVLLFASTVAAGDWAYFDTQKSVSVPAVSADGKHYVVVVTGEFEDPDDHGKCKYPAFPPFSAAGIDEVEVRVCEIRGACESVKVAAWAADEQGLQLKKCTAPDAFAAHENEVRELAKKAGIDVDGKHAAAISLARGEGELGHWFVTVPAASMKPFGVEEDVELRLQTMNGDGWLMASSKSCGTARVQSTPAQIMVETIGDTFMIPGQPFLVVPAMNGRGWLFAIWEVPLARLAVRLLTARAQKTRSMADVDAALALDPSFKAAIDLKAALAAVDPKANAAKLGKVVHP